jgi:soluble lytic murein transglycosylase
MLEHWAYPVKFEEIVQQKSEEYGVPLSVIYAVIRTESGFDPEAESWAGARGLMQITKDAHDWMDYYRGESFGTWDEILDPEVNISYGVWLLSYSYEKFGNWETVFAAYNAGINAVAKWLENPEYSADGITLLKIPYEETSNYVEKVSAYREGYKNAYGFD